MRDLAACALLAFAATAHAQRADCPHLDAPVPARPPGEAPPILPPFNPPERFEDALRQPPPQSRELSRDEFPADAMKDWDRQVDTKRANDWLTPAQEGHVAMVAHAAVHAQRSTPPPELAAAATDMGGSLLAAWSYLGFAPAGPHHVRRYWRAGDGSIIEVDEHDLEAAGGAVFTLPGMDNARVGARPATVGGLRSPSGCIASSLGWYDERRSYALQLVGPLDLSRQRAVLMEVARWMASR
jgi:hypothetical protein